MKQYLKRALCLFFCAVMLLSAVACGGSGDGTETGTSAGDQPTDKTYTYDPETYPMTFAIGALDGNFNPFFYTSANDGGILSMTQIGMLSTDSKGNLVCGEDYATVALYMKTTMYDASGNVTPSGDNDGWSDYEFVIKNGIKFSDGQPLTIKDVLFNLYVYLDPMYTGSSTIYSTDIQGLKAYQAQDPTLADDSDVENSASFYSEAQQRVYNMIEYLTDKTNNPATDQILKDLETTKRLFREELTSDWSSIYGTLESFTEYTFTEDWQSYYLNEGIVTVQTEINAQGTTVKKKDANGKYITTLDDPNSVLASEMAEALSADKIKAYATEHSCSEEDARVALMKEKAIETVYASYTSYEPKIADILSYWATGSNVLEDFAAEAKSAYYESHKGDVKSISGITTYKTTSFDGHDLGEEHDVLKISINGIDPKAIWNFAFTVAPMHYYSNAEQVALFDGVSHFGVDFGSKTFFDEVLKDPDKNGLPVGAGAYKATDAKDSDTPTRDGFYSNNYAYYKRNEYFETVGEQLNNAKIRLFRYRVVSSDNIVNALKTGEVLYGEPNAKTENISAVGSEGDLSYKTYRTGGYGYVGLNPKYIPDIEVRQAIMRAMNTATIVKDYYTAQLAELIYRPMSVTSWAYPDGCTPYYDYTTSKDEIQALVMSAGWTLNANNKFEKNGKTLKFTFTIAGETVDHPAYNMFQLASEFLNECGFDTTVSTDVNALKKLATGGLEVWAAAWSSASDPDMFQNYHKDSTANATKNWYCQGMLDDTSGQFDFEKAKINELAELIEEARETNNQDERKAIYSDALDVVMEMCIELPTYQRNDLAVFNTKILDVNTLNMDPSYNEGVVSRIWEVDYN